METKQTEERTNNPFEPVFLIRTNYYQKDANNVDKLMDYLFENDIVSINVRDRKNNDDEYYYSLFNGKIEKQDLKKNYINRFYKLANDLKNSDVIVIAHYVGKSPKIGLIKKGSTVFVKEDAGEIYKLYCLKMENVQNVSSDDTKRFLTTLIPANVTMATIKQKQDVIYSMYYGIPIPFKLSSVSDSALEELCAEYLRSSLSYQSVRVLGGTFPDVDIIGYKSQNELFVAQVSRTANKKLINEKKEKLCSFVEAKHKILFSTQPSKQNPDYENINIQEVWNYFENDESYKEFLEKLIKI